ncbi:MAG: hypothetical protein GEU79_15740, partial [Acidimicrobiia bacterium]|nr:hypothetical protein [Acidimicrobiia bacterium]
MANGSPCRIGRRAAAGIPSHRGEPAGVVCIGETMTKIDEVELHRIEMPLVGAFRTSFGTEVVREALLVKVVADGQGGWGECVSGSEPRYSSEYVGASEDVLHRFLGPALISAGEVTAADLSGIFSGFKGFRMAKSALEMAFLDAELRGSGVSL